jgi:hypothetical protein
MKRKHWELGALFCISTKLIFQAYYTVKHSNPTVGSHYFTNEYSYTNREKIP